MMPKFIAEEQVFTPNFLSFWRKGKLTRPREHSDPGKREKILRMCGINALFDR
jgi:hypothetical protein